MANRLANESSPYLLQHANNPVDWYPWGPEAIGRAVAEDKPIFLSIGYSACHWCHVMEHESFESAAIARLMNENFICIKVDREERPDLDQIYMNAVQMMTGRGGWPMSVFLTPDLKPFYGGTYWPPSSRMGMPGFDQVLLAVADAWQHRREQAIEQAATLTEHLREVASPTAQPIELHPRLLQGAATTLERIFDPNDGGFGHAPKFPHPMDLRLLLQLWHSRRRDAWLQMVTFTLDKMAAGGIYDQLGGGFHRYSVDQRWLVPHFEKMLYDNALLSNCYVDAYLATGKPDYARVARETCDYVLREMTDPAGGFYSTQDADSEGEEGKFFLWTPQQVEEVLGADAAKTFCYVYDVTEEGNFEGRNILNQPKTIEQCAAVLQRDAEQLRAELNDSRQKLLAARESRVHPGRDDKVLVSWNGLMIDSMAQAAGALDEPRYLQAAAAAAEFILANLRRDDGRLLHSWRNGVARFDAYLDDYTCLINGLVSLYEASFDERWIDRAVEMTNFVLQLFPDVPNGGFFYTASDHEQLITRQKDLYDNAVPSGNAMAATALVRLSKLTGQNQYAQEAERTLNAASELMQQTPTATGQMLLALDLYLGPTPELVLLGHPHEPDTQEVITALRHRYIPRKVVALRPPTGPTHPSPALDSLFAGKELTLAEPMLFVCQHFTCDAPIGGKQDVLAAIDRLANPTQP